MPQPLNIYLSRTSSDPRAARFAEELTVNGARGTLYLPVIIAAASAAPVRQSYECSRSSRSALDIFRAGKIAVKTIYNIESVLRKCKHAWGYLFSSRYRDAREYVKNYVFSRKE